MEVYAAFMEHTDHHVGRLIDTLKDLGVYDDTLVYVIIGDNGASAEGTLQGAFNEMAYFNGMAALETPEFLVSKLDEFGSPSSYNHYAVGWAWAMDTPYQWTKQVASHWGGTRNGTVVRYPRLITDKGGVRNQFCHVIDVAPTILEAAGIPEPTSVHGIQQSPYEGTSMLYSFADAEAPERHEIQYFEMFGNRGIYSRGWSAVTKHSTPWMTAQAKPAFDDDVWELYDGSSDWTQAHDLSSDMPEKLRELQRQFLIEATRYNVVPLDDRSIERIIPEDRGPAVPDQGHLPAAVQRHGPAVGEQRGIHQEQVVQPDRERGRTGGRCRGHDHRLRVGASVVGRSTRAPAPRSSSTTSWASTSSRSSRRSRSRLARTRCGWSSPMRAVGWARVAPSLSTTMGTQSAPARWASRSQWSSRPMRRPMWATRAAPR